MSTDEDRSERSHFLTNHMPQRGWAVSERQYEEAIASYDLGGCSVQKWMEEEVVVTKIIKEMPEEVILSERKVTPWKSVRARLLSARNSRQWQ